MIGKLVISVIYHYHKGTIFKVSVHLTLLHHWLYSHNHSYFHYHKIIM